MRNCWVPIKKTDKHINIEKICISALIQLTYFPLTLARTCKIHDSQGLNIPKSVINLRLEKQKLFMSGQVCFALSKVTNI